MGRGPGYLPRGAPQGDDLQLTPVIEVRGVSRRFASVTAVDGATWAARPGAVSAVLGPNGAGKSTTVDLVAGFHRPDAGTVRVLGVDPWRAGPDHRARVGVMLQDGGLPQQAHPLPVLRHLARLYADPRPVAELAGALGVDTLTGRSIRRLSGGEKRRVALAAALVGRPDVALLDEPTAGVDPHARRDVWSLIRSEADRGVSVLLTTHSFEEAERLADHVVVLVRGRVAAQGTVAEVTGAHAGLEEAYFALTDDAGTAGPTQSREPTEPTGPTGADR